MGKVELFGLIEADSMSELWNKYIDDSNYSHIPPKIISKAITYLYDQSCRSKIVYYIANRDITLQSIYHFDGKSIPVILNVKAGYVTDFGSIPRAFQNLFSPTESGMRIGYLGHDIGYTLKRMEIIGSSEMIKGPAFRKMLDIRLADSAVAHGMSAFKVGLLYSAIRCGGGSYFNDTSPLDELNQHLASMRYTNVN